MMSKKKDPFVNYSTKQILDSEAFLYTIQVGEEAFEVEGSPFFAKKAAQSYYTKILKEILYQFYNGTEEDKLKARAILLTFRMSPLRFH